MQRILGEFVKHGAKRAEIEIELARDPSVQERNPTITTGITKEGNKADYAINRRKSNKKSVQELARSFSIQVDNLCQFLPQDRVVEFAALSPEKLLIETQRAAAPDYMTEWHEQLKEWRMEQKEKQHEQQGLMESLKQDENRQTTSSGGCGKATRALDFTRTKEDLGEAAPFPRIRDCEAAPLRGEATQERGREGALAVAAETGAEPSCRRVEAVISRGCGQSRCHATAPSATSGNHGRREQEKV